MTRQLLDARTAVERNRSELENAKAYLESVLANMSAGVMVLDEQGHLVTCNESVERILQRPVEGEVGKALHEIPGLDQFAAAIDKAFAEQQMDDGNAAGKQEHWQQQIEIPRPDAEPQGEKPADAMPNNVAQNITLLARGSHLPVGAGEGYVIVFDDITKVISAQRSIAWGEVARRLAHEIKNPLTPIRLSAERIAKKFGSQISDPAFQDSIKMIVSQVDDMRILVNEFSQFARLPQIKTIPGQLNDVLEKSAQIYSETQTHIKFVVQLDKQLPEFKFDPDQLKRVFVNLIDNAVAAVQNTAGAMIKIQTEYNKVQQVLKISIADNGVGIAPRDKVRVFEPYFSTKEKGTGLGLPIVKSIIEDHGGIIRALDNEPTGTKMYIEIPIIPIEGV